MPTLNKYAQSNKKTGHFVRANVGGSHPVTLQTTNVAERVFRDNGYSNGSTVPTKLVWSMYDVDLLYTESSLSASTPSHSFSSLSDAVNGSKLTEETRHGLIEYFSSYTGSHQRAVSRILEELRRTISTDTVEKYDISDPVESTTAFFEKYSNQAIDELNRMLDEREEPVHSSLLTFAQRAPQLEGIETTGRPSIAYQFTPLSVAGEVTVYDLTISDGRGSNGQYDYRIEYRDGPTSSVYVRDGSVQKINGPSDNLSPPEARRLAGELTPVPISQEDVLSAVDAPAVSELDIPDGAFIQGDTDLLIGVVDRISNSDNPLVELENGHLLLDVGEEDGLYLINRIEPKWGRVLCELSQPDT